MFFGGEIALLKLEAFHVLTGVSVHQSHRRRSGPDKAREAGVLHRRVQELVSMLLNFLGFFTGPGQQNNPERSTLASFFGLALKS